MLNKKNILNEEETEKKISDSKELNMDELDEVIGGTGLKEAGKKKTEPINTRIRKSV